MIDSSVYDYIESFVDKNSDIISLYQKKYYAGKQDILNKKTLKSLLRQIVIDDAQSEYAYATVKPNPKGEGYISYKLVGNISFNLKLAVEIATIVVGNINGEVNGLVVAALSIIAIILGCEKRLTPMMGYIVLTLYKRNYTEENEQSVRYEDLWNMVYDEYGTIDSLTKENFEEAINGLIEIKTIGSTDEREGFFLLESVKV